MECDPVDEHFALGHTLERRHQDETTRTRVVHQRRVEVMDGWTVGLG